MRTAAGGSSPQQIFDAFEVSHVFHNSSQIETETIDIDGITVAISGISHNPLLDEGADPLQGNAIDTDADLSILLTHYGVEEHLAGRTNEPVISHGSLDTVGVDILCSGHIHKPTDFRIGSHQVIVPGATERMEFGEIDRDTGFYELTSNGDTVETRYVSLEAQPMRDETVSANDLTGENPTQKILELVNELSESDQLFKFRFEGTLSREAYHRLNIHEIWDQGRNSNFYFDIVDDIEFEVEDRVDLSGERLSQIDELKRVAEQVEESVAEENEKTVVREARELVLSDYGGEQ
jgi:DNA repair exonuclease SbcCD nuclease subunit